MSIAEFSIRLKTAALAAALAIGAAAPAYSQKSMDLKDYVSSPSPHYKVINTKKIDFNDALWRYEIDMQSVKWRSPEEVSKPVWRHKLIIFTAKSFHGKTIALGIGSGNNSFESGLAIRHDEEKLARDIAEKTGHASALLTTIPNQPLQFMKDGVDRYEDDLIAYSWDKYLKTLEPEWIAYWPMVKSTHLAMDAIISALSIDEPSFEGANFVLYGASKRGLTTWLTAAVDDRVAGIAPIVIDMVNSIVSLKNHYNSLGEWSFALKDYVHHKIVDRIDTPEMLKLADRIDPLSYNEVLGLPKLILNAANDQFFTPDSSTFYFGQLHGPKWIRYYPNIGHRRIGMDLATPISTLLQYVHNPKKMAPMDWAMTADGSMVYSADPMPSKVVLWEAVNPKAKDFRLMSADFPRYVPKELPPMQKTFKVQKPSKGYKSYFFEFTTKLPSGEDFVQTTSARIMAADSSLAP